LKLFRTVLSLYLLPSSLPPCLRPPTRPSWPPPVRRASEAYPPPQSRRDCLQLQDQGEGPLPRLRLPPRLRLRSRRCRSSDETPSEASSEISVNQDFMDIKMFDNLEKLRASQRMQQQLAQGSRDSSPPPPSASSLITQQVMLAAAANPQQRSLSSTSGPSDVLGITPSLRPGGPRALKSSRKLHSQQ
jgi:hypothetical protein